MRVTRPEAAPTVTSMITEAGMALVPSSRSTPRLRRVLRRVGSLVELAEESALRLIRRSYVV